MRNKLPMVCRIAPNLKIYRADMAFTAAPQTAILAFF
jgi:hypothetical protein